MRGIRREARQMTQQSICTRTVARTVVAVTMIEAPGSQFASLTKADDKVDGEEGVGLAGWGGAENYDVVICHGLAFQLGWW